jgi:hypothetical protein
MFPKFLTDSFESVRCAVSCGNSSVGRARPCQGRGREFESRFPLQISAEAPIERSGLLRLRHRIPSAAFDCRDRCLRRIASVSARCATFISGRSGIKLAGSGGHQATQTMPPAWWQSGHAAACKAAYAGSIPTQASSSSRYRATARYWKKPRTLRGLFFMEVESLATGFMPVTSGQRPISGNRAIASRSRTASRSDRAAGARPGDGPCPGPAFRRRRPATSPPATRGDDAGRPPARRPD